MLTPARVNEGNYPNYHPLSWQAPGLLPPFQCQMIQAVSMRFAGQKQENQPTLRNPVTKNKKHTNTNHAS